jgi:3-hydroxyanthranilate 3,4-dioxygenase
MIKNLVSPLNLKAWIDEHRHLLKPPVGNKCVWEDGDFIVMVVGGPNSRKDFHYNETPEFFYQIEGDIKLRIIKDGKPEDVMIREGEIYLLPPGVPHSPQRPANTIGLVIEYKRPPGMRDALQWYCEGCGDQLYEEDFRLENIVTDLPKIFGHFYQSEERRTCKECGSVMTPPAPVSA